MSHAWFESMAVFPLRHAGDCSLLGVSADGTIYVEETYGDGWVAQHALSADGAVTISVDEDGGQATDLQPLPLPADLTRSHTGWHTMELNFSGPRQRGLREPERVLELVRPLVFAEKMMLNQRFGLDIPPLQLGLAESYVLAEAQLNNSAWFVVCRRIRVAVALPEPQQDAFGLPCDYDTRVLYLAQVFDRDNKDAPTLLDPEKDLLSADLARPMDCVIAGDKLYVADGGENDRLSAIHIFQCHDLPSRPSPDEVQLKKLYG